MRSFKDRDNKEWFIEILPIVVQRIRENLDFDLVGLDPKSLDRLDTDIILLHEVLWELCKDQAERDEIDVTTFAKAVAGDPVDAAYDAILGAVVDFSRGRTRSQLEKGIALTAKLRKKENALVMERLTDPKLETKLEKAMEKAMEANLENALTRLSSAKNLPV